MTPSLSHEVMRLHFQQLHRLIAPSSAMTGVDAVQAARTELLRYLRTYAGSQHRTWQDAWNALTGATSHRPGRLELRHPVCRECNGRRFSLKASSLSRAMMAGLPTGTCMACRGTGREDWVTLLAVYAEPPTEAERHADRLA